LLVALFASLLAQSAGPEASAKQAAAPTPARIISLNPSLTAILLALGQGERLVGVDDFSAQQMTQVSQLPRVGGLFAPSLEAVVALEPDLVVLVPSAEQRDFRQRLEALEIEVEAFQNHQFDEVLENITRLGSLTGASGAAQKRVTAIEQMRDAVERTLASLERDAGTWPSVAMVLQRDPLFVVGGGNFIDTMLTIAGARNIAAEYREAFPRVAMEWLVAASPELLVDLSPEAAAGVEDAMAFWKRWPNIEAVKNERLLPIDAALISMPGPALDESLLLLARTFWGAEVAAKVRLEAQSLARGSGS
jgi:iron complex transport system substrate-binding protein